MMRLPRVLRTAALVCAISTPSVVFVPSLLAQDAVPAAAAGGAEQAPPLNPELVRAVEQFWHFGKIANYPAAAQAGQQLLATYQDQRGDLLRAFEQVATQRRDNIDTWMLRWQGVEPLREVATQLYSTLEEARRDRAGNPDIIQQNIERLTGGERPYTLAVQRLRASGEVAVERMIAYLRDPAQAEYHAAIRRALRDMGRPVLNPLLAATKMSDAATLVAVVDVLGDLGYDASVPYLARLAQTSNDAGVKQAAARALSRMGAGDGSNIDIAESFYELAEKLYYDNASITANTNLPNAIIWNWDDNRGLLPTEIPPAIFNELMAMRASEYALKANPDMGKALSLWLAANFKREAELPEGGTDATRAAGQPDAHYYAVAAGTDYTSQVLDRAMNDRSAPVALRAVLALKEIAGRSNVLGTEQVQILVSAMRYPDRLVRINAAEAVAMALPQQSFDGIDRVVPVLAEAVAQTGQTNVLVILPDQNALNGMLQGLKDGGYAAAGGTSVDAAIAESNVLPAVDVILVSEDVGADQVQRLMEASAGNPRLEATAKLVLTKSPASIYAVQSVNNPLLSVSQATTPDALKEDIGKARTRAGGLQLDEEGATAIAMRAADLLERIAVSNVPALNVAVAEPTLLASLNDQRPDLVKNVGEVIGLINSRSAQQGLLSKAVDEKTAPDVAVSLFNSLATSAKMYGNLLEGAQVDQLTTVVEKAENLDVRSAAAEAHGALNLPADRAKQLIVNQSRD
jgi:hypothetical protein